MADDGMKVKKESRNGMSLFWRTAICVALVFPWLILQASQPGQKPDLGYALGLACGAVTVYIWSDRPPKFWIIALTSIILMIVHFVLVRFPH